MPKISEGYGRPLKFIHTSQRLRAKDEAHASTDRSPASKDTLPPKRTVTSNDAGLALTSHAALQKSVVADSCSGLFLNLFLGSTGYSTKSLSQFCFTGWMVATSQISHINSTLRDALLALGLARVGKLTQDSRIMHKSQQFYSSALNKLYQKIKKNPVRLDDESLAGVVYLSIYEAIEGSPMRGLGWTSHTDGATRLIKLQPCSSEWTEFRKKLFLGLRFFAVIRAICSRQPSFLASPEWTDLPWLPTGNQLSHQLIYLLASIPPILRDIDSIQDNHSCHLPSKIKEVSTDCSRLLNELHLWNVLFQSEKQGSSYSEMPSTLAIGRGKKFASEHPVFSTYLHFPDIETAHLQMLYWTAQLLIYNNLWLAYRSLETRVQPTYDQGDPLLNLSPDLRGDPEGRPPCRMSALSISTSDLRAIAINIARSLEYFLNPESMAIGVTMFAFPVIISLNYFQYLNLLEAAWFRIIFDHILISSGIDVSGFIEAVSK
ncbi:hypothetical protein FQN49_005752 [Arthroderma sp. PD_2]|nr:hypothetical protein FQN49_005752 [Arthroderma sp. PD_2]